MSNTAELPADAYEELDAAERQPHQPRARRSFHWPTLALVLALVATLGFLAGVQVQKRHTPAATAVGAFGTGTAFLFRGVMNAERCTLAAALATVGKGEFATKVVEVIG